MNATLYYLHDPMCSWCWGYRPVWQTLQSLITEKHPYLTITYVVGGLAPDSVEPMPEAMQHAIQGHWKRIHKELGTTFNHDFWVDNTPRRSTYPACRAVLAAKEFGAEQPMIEAIQRGYYLNAVNPSDNAVLIQLAGTILEEATLNQFIIDLTSKKTEEELQRHLVLSQHFHQQGVANGFPSLALEVDGRLHGLTVDYKDETITLNQINSILA